MLAAPELELGEQGAEQVGWKLEVTEDGDQPAGRRTGGGWGSGPGGVPGEALVFLKHIWGRGVSCYQCDRGTGGYILSATSCKMALELCQLFLPRVKST